MFILLIHCHTAVESRYIFKRLRDCLNILFLCFKSIFLFIELQNYCQEWIWWFSANTKYIIYWYIVNNVEWYLSHISQFGRMTELYLYILMSNGKKFSFWWFRTNPKIKEEFHPHISACRLSPNLIAYD